ncbi:MAG: ABC transporter ATP-binding protein [Bacteroidales bacterium]|nr:ABC transporter ATP-binding protein [Bacteroidales bacterium]
MNAIEFDHVGKLYQLGSVGTGTLSHDLNRWWQTRIRRREDPYLRVGETNDRASKGGSGFVWALKDISFDVEEGEVVGIIGKNGAGKSTLLKLLSQVTAPTTGEIRAWGRIASLLEVGTGFHQEMTGRENIYMNGAIMGMTRAEIRAKFDDIVDFAGVARYIDTPVKRYSSGMTVRLGFAVAAFLEPEILVVDEVLAVGDAEFQKKAVGKMQDVSRGEGRTVLFVSHNMAAVRSLCQRGVVLDRGGVVFDGGVAEAIDHYMLQNKEQKEKIINHIHWAKPHLQIDRIVVNGTEDDHSILHAGQTILPVRVEGQSSIDFKTDLIVLLKSPMDVPLASLNEGVYKGSPLAFKSGHFSISKDIVLPKYLCRGNYVVDIVLQQPGSEYQLGARHAAFLHAEGNADAFARPMSLNDSGLMGLETLYPDA